MSLIEEILTRDNLDEAYMQVKDGPTVSLIRSFLKSGVMEDGVFSTTTDGVSQGGPLSPMLSNI